MYKILHLEDQLEFYYLLKDFLSNEDFQLYFAPDVEQAMFMTNSTNFDLIISDIRLETGTTAPYIKFLNDNQIKTPLIIFSSSSLQELGSDLRSLNFVTFFSKNKMEDLCLRIKKIFSDENTIITRKAI